MPTRNEALARIYRAAGVDLDLGKPDCEITPGDLADRPLGLDIPRNW